MNKGGNFVYRGGDSEEEIAFGSESDSGNDDDGDVSKLV